MPVPRYESQVQAAPFPGVRASGEAPLQALGGATAAPAVAGFSHEVYKYAEEQKKAADDAAAQEAFSKATQARNNLVYNPKDGLVTMRGHDALKAPDIMAQRFNSHMDDIANGLNNPVQKEMFAKIRAQQQAELDGKISSHVSGEILGIEDSAFKSSVGTTIDDGVTNYRDRGKIDGTKRMLQALIVDRAQKLGWDSATTRQTLDESVSQMNKGIVFRELANSNVPAAEVWYQHAKNRGELTGRDATDIEERLQPARKAYGTQVNLQQASAVADEFMMGYSDKTVALQDMEQKYGDKPFFKEARSEFERKFKDREDANQFGHVDTVWNATQAALDGKPIDPVMMSKLSDAERRKVNEYAAGVQRWGKEAVSASGDSFVFLQKLAAEKPDVFMRTNLIEYGLEPDLLKSMRNLQLGLRNKDSKAAETLDGIMGQQARVKLGAEALRYRSPADQAAFEMTVNKSVNEFERRNRRKMTDDEFQKNLDQLIIDLKQKKRPLYKQPTE